MGVIAGDIEVMRCPKCHGALEFVSGTFPTGVRAPDGVEETAYDEFYYCVGCVRGFSPNDLEVDEEIKRDFPAEFNAYLDRMCSQLADDFEAIDRKHGLAPHDYSALRKPLAEGDK